MTDGIKTFLTLAISIAAFVVGSSLQGSTDHQVVFLQYVAVGPMVFLAFSTFIFRWPKYIIRYFNSVAERDAHRGLISVKNLGMAVILLLALLLFIAY